MTEPRDETVAKWYRNAAIEEPPASLDAAVLAAAHRAVAARPQALGSTRRKLWLMPMAAAAVLVLSVTILRLTPTNEVLPEGTDSAAPLAPARTAPKAERPSSVDEGAGPPPTKSAEAQMAEYAKDAATAAQVSVEPTRRSLAREAKGETAVDLMKRPAPESRQTATANAFHAAEAQWQRPPAPTAPPPAATAAPAAVVPVAKPDQRRSEPESAASGLPDGALALPRRSISAVEVELAPQDREAPPPQLGAGPQGNQASLGRSAPAPARAKEGAQADTGQAGPSQIPAGAAWQPKQAEKRRLIDAAPAKLPKPEIWVHELLKLQAEAPEAEFLQALAEFLVAYPEHPLPPPLRAALPRLQGEAPSPFPARR